MCCLPLFLCMASGQTATGSADRSPIRFSMSIKLFREVNENDAVASLKAYAEQIAASRSLVADPNPRIFNGADELTRMLIRGEVDLVSLPTQEFLTLEENLVTGPILISLVNGSDYEEYVLLVRTDSPAMMLADLKGQRLLLLDSLNASLARPWLEVALNEKKLAPPEAFFNRLTQVTKTSQAVLPVFFRQSDACVVTRQGFALMGELNPQLTKQLRALALSPQLVPHLTCFRIGFDPSLKEKIVAAITGAQGTAAGKQMMTIFGCDQVQERSLASLKGTRVLLEDYDRLHATAGKVGAEEKVTFSGERTGGEP